VDKNDIPPTSLPVRPGSNVATISEHRRKEILAQLASERVGRRGFASEREVRVSEEAKAAATSLPIESNIANNPRTSAVQAALQSAASAAVSSALNKALQSLSKNESEPLGSMATPLVSALRDLGSSSSSNSGSNSAVIGSPSKSEKDKLVARLIAERRERMETDSLRGGLSSSLGHSSAGSEYIRLGSSSALPPVPPVVAALQAQAAAAAAAAAAAMATATVSAHVAQNNLNASRLGSSLSSDRNEKSFQENQSSNNSDISPRLEQSPNETQKRSESTRTRNEGTSVTSKEKKSGDDRSFKRKSKEELRREREAVLYGECTFKPAIVSGKSSSSSTFVVSSSGSGGEGALDARFDALAQSKNKAWEERERLRKESEKVTIESECTFQPNVNATGGLHGQHSNTSFNGLNGQQSNTSFNRGNSNSPPPSRAKSPAPVTTRSKTPILNERMQSASEQNRQTKQDAPPSLRISQAPPTVVASSLGSPSKPGSPLLWERSLARQYLEGSAGAITAATAKARAIAQSQQTSQAMEPVLPANTPAVPPSRLAPTPIASLPPRPQPPAPPSVPQWKPAPPSAVVIPSVLREPEPEPVPAVVTRLYMEAEVRNSERAKAKAAAEKAQLAEFKFKPTINTTSTALAADQRRPVHERTAEVQQAKEERIHRLRMEGILSNQDLTFKPKINEVSERIAIMKLRQQGLPVSDAPGSTVGESKEGPDVASTKRLTLATTEYEKRREARTKAAAEAELRAFSFKPRLNKNSEKIVEQKVGEDGGGFMARQAQVAEAQKRHREALIAQLKLEDECKFKPDIGNAEEFLALTRPDLVTESAESRINRMSVEESEKRRAAQADAEKEYYNQFNYQPEINQLSKRRGRAHTVEEHYKDEEGHRARLRAKLQAEEEFKRQHPFKPTRIAADLAPETASGDSEDAEADEVAIAEGKMPLRLAVASDPDRVSARINAHLKGKAARSEAAKRLLDYEKLKECTFQPETDRSSRSLAKLKEQVAADGGVVVVRGLGRYLELKELTRKLDEDKEQREREAFSKPGFSWPEGMTKPPTVPQPFHLSSADTALAHLAQREAQIAKEKATAEAAAEASAVAEERRIAALRLSSSSSSKTKQNKQQQQPQQQKQSSARAGMHPSQQHILLQQALDINDDFSTMGRQSRDSSSLLTGPALNITKL